MEKVDRTTSTDVYSEKRGKHVLSKLYTYRINRGGGQLLRVSARISFRALVANR